MAPADAPLKIVTEYEARQVCSNGRYVSADQTDTFMRLVSLMTRFMEAIA